MKKLHLGPIGMASTEYLFIMTEMVAMFLDALTITTFDYSGAHPGPGQDYHYHTTGRYTTQDDAKLVWIFKRWFSYIRQKRYYRSLSPLDAYGGHTGLHRISPMAYISLPRQQC
ncbi:MAG: hypothetical protein IPL55_13915 [Saprospiraceae bacterium]|nr:hypothetical protein [Saprospiraceae bacterium]